MVSAFLSPFGYRHSLLGHPLPAAELGLPYGRLTGPRYQGPDDDGVATFHTHEMRSGWVPSKPRGRRCPHGRLHIFGRHLPHRNGKVPGPQYRFHRLGLCMTRHHRGFTCVHPSDLPPACDPRMEQESLGVFPRASHPAVTGSACRGGDRHVGHSPGLCDHHGLRST